MSEQPSLVQAVTSESRLLDTEHGLLARRLGKLPGIAAILAKCVDIDDLLQKAAMRAGESLGFRRVAVWLLDKDGTFAVGSLGDCFGKNSEAVQNYRLLDKSGYLRSLKDAWMESPHYIQLSSDSSGSASRLLGLGISLTAPILMNAEIVGFVGVAEPEGTASVDEVAGPLLCQFAQVVSSAVSTLKLREELERSKAAVVEAERVQSEFLAMMGHEVRTPLNAMMGYAQLLARREVGSEIKGIANTIEESGQHMKGLIDSVLEYSHLSSGDLRRWYKPGDPFAVLESTVRSFKEMYRKKGLDLGFSWEGDPVSVFFDPISLRQVLSNLLQNALKFTEKGGAHVRAFSRADSESSKLFIDVTDTGIGIDEAHQRSIFQPFRQVAKDRDGGRSGIGMGLAIVKRLVEAMGGAITCRSGGESGTVFSISLTFNNAITPTHSADERVSPDEKAASRVLIVEDDEINLEVLRSMANCLGYVNTDSARNGIEARELLSEYPYDIVLMDVQMPRMDGISLTRIVRSGEVSSINREVPIVGVTAYTSEHDRDECLTVGMNDYLPKPIMLDSLRKVMELA
ncbi:response regulator [Pelagicoccus sp. SDUM812002]|uniref:hybrid sensor histidine kinase/response regulator n=1 Tax=Pelagicoccus sp. SDUM812002 TaxID=3041266 RepID=UPI00280C688D|nr:response regulator [Pelagicoccus sp. SDUM812002]MDQ8186766.1 response regulator [Pelagicoccus sp. SDUM812002]